MCPIKGASGYPFYLPEVAFKTVEKRKSEQLSENVGILVARGDERQQQRTWPVPYGLI